MGRLPLVDSLVVLLLPIQTLVEDSFSCQTKCKAHDSNSKEIHVWIQAARRAWFLLSSGSQHLVPHPGRSLSAVPVGSREFPPPARLAASAHKAAGVGCLLFSLQAWYVTVSFLLGVVSDN